MEKSEVEALKDKLEEQELTNDPANEVATISLNTIILTLLFRKRKRRKRRRRIKRRMEKQSLQIIKMRNPKLLILNKNPNL